MNATQPTNVTRTLIKPNIMPDSDKETSVTAIMSAQPAVDTLYSRRLASAVIANKKKNARINPLTALSRYGLMLLSASVTEPKIDSDDQSIMAKAIVIPARAEQMIIVRSISLSSLRYLSLTVKLVYLFYAQL